MTVGAGLSSVWLGGNSTAGLREVLLLQQDHKCGDCGAALDGFVAWAVPLASGQTVACCSACTGRYGELLRRSRRL
jgi:hypothetical protein